MKLWQRYKNVVWFFTITLLIVLYVYKYIGFERVQVSENYLWGLILTLDTASAIALSVLAVLAYLEYAKGEDEIEIILNVEGKEYRIKELRILRKVFTRAEILGVLGMIQNDSKMRFDFEYLTDFGFLEQINEIQKGNNDKFTVELSKEEFERFFSKFFENKER